MAIKVYINEPIGGLTDQSARLWYGGQNGFTLIRGQRGTASIVFEIAAGDSYQSTVGSPIFIHEISSVSPLYDVIVYAGRIQKIERKWIGDQGDHDDTLTCVSLESCFDTIRIDPPTSYSGMTGGQIITAIFNTYCAGSLSPLVPGVPVTLGTIDLTTGGVLPTQVYRQSERVSDVFTALATLMGTTIIWGVQMSDQTLYARATSLVPSPFVLDAYLYETGDWIEDETDYRNRQLVQGSFTAWSTSNEMFPGDSVSHSARLRITVDRLTSAMLTTSTQATAVGVFGTLSPVASNNPAPGDTFTITPPHSPPVVEDPYTFVTALDNTLRNQILIGSTAAATCQNTVDALNANPLKAGITFSLPTWENDACNADPPMVGAVPPRFTLRVKNPGAGGNGCVLTSVRTASPLTFGALLWQGETLSPFSPAQTAGGTDGTMSALNVSVAGANTLSTDVQYTPGSNLVTFTAAIPGGASISIAYYGLGRDTLAVEDTAAVALRAAAEHGSGRYQQLITDTQNADARAIYIEALSALNNFKVIPEQFQFSIFQARLSPGQLLTISILSPTGAPALLDGTWLVQEIQATIEPGVETLPEPYGHFKYLVTVINTNMISTFVDFWQNLAIVTPAGAQTVNNVSIQVASPSLNAPLPTNTPPPTPGTSPPNTTGTLAPIPAGQQWVQEAPGRYAIVKSNDLQVNASLNTRVSSSVHVFVGGDVGEKVIVLAGVGWTPGEYTIIGIAGSDAILSSSPAPVNTIGGIWALVDNGLWCTTWVPSNSFTGNQVMILTKNGLQLDPFTPHSVGYTPGAGDYTLQKGNQIAFASAPDPASDELIATYFPDGIIPAPVTPGTAKVAVTLDVLATDFPAPYTPTSPPGGDRHLFDVTVGPPDLTTVQEVQATISVVGTTDSGIIWSLISTDAVTTDPVKIGSLSTSPNGVNDRIYSAPLVLPSTLTPALPDTVTLGVVSHADSTVKASDTITLMPPPTPPPPGARFVTVSDGSSTADQVQNSPDAVVWTGQTSPAGALGGKCIANFGAGKFCALVLDAGGTTWISIVSTDGGASWTSHAIAQPAGVFIYLIFSGGQLIALATTGEVLTSPDGVTWALRATITIANVNGWNAITFGAGLYVVVGDSNTSGGNLNIASSPDLIAWTTRTGPVTVSAVQFWDDVIFAGGQFVAVGDYQGFSAVSGWQVMTSADGITWTGRVDQGPAQQFWGIAFGGSGGWYVSAQAGAIETSTDAITWASHSVADSTGLLNRVRFLHSLFVVCDGDSTVGNPQILTAPDPTSTWTTQTCPLDHVFDVAFG